MSNRLIVTGLIIIHALMTGCVHNSQKVENIRTFAKVYGYVRWFYPGDEAAGLNWSRFAALGVSQVENATNQKELKKIMIELFEPIAPAIQIDDISNAPGFDLQSIVPNNQLDFKPVYWKHYGVYLGEKSNIYQSIRINRDSTKDKNICLAKYLSDIFSYRDKEVKMIVSIKSAKEAVGKVYLCLTSMKDIGPDYLSILKNHRQIVMATDRWGEFETTIKLNNYDNCILYGIDVEEQLPLYISDLKLMVRENKNWKQISSTSTDFENPNGENNKFLYDFKIDKTQKKDGKDVIQITQTTQATKVGEFIKKNIGNNLVCTMPLALYGTNEHTYPVADTVALKKLSDRLKHLTDADLNTRNLNVRLANVVIAWNVLQHFYPYFDVVHVDWEKELSNTLGDVYKNKTESDFFKTLCGLIAKLQDGHGVVYNNNIPQWGLPVSYALVENQVVISGSKSLLFHRGDIIKSIDGRNALEELQREESLVSGSPQLRRYRALNIFGSDFSQSEARIELIRENKTIEVKAKRDFRCNLFFNSIGSVNLKGKEYKDGIYYENSRSTEFKNELPYLINSKGIIVDPMSDLYELIPHIIKEPVWSPIWNIPLTRYPDRENVTFISSRWKIDPVKPFISAKLVFLEEPFRVSSGETILSFIDYYKLGKLVGDTTAGTNGNVNFIPLIGDYSIMWTGMKVLKQDSSQHHLIGYRPDYPVKRTIKAIKEGRNEHLDKALEVLEN